MVSTYNNKIVNKHITNPNCDYVLNATTFFKSNSEIAAKAPSKAPKLPNQTIIIKELELNSKIGLILINKKTPAVTMVDECYKADTLVGPSIAFVYQVCSPIIADLAAAAPIKQIQKINNRSPFKEDARLNIVPKDKSENIAIEIINPHTREKSPIRFINSAFIAARLASILVNQNPTNK